MSMDNTVEQKGHHTPGPWYAVRNSSYWEVNPQREYEDDHIPYTVADVCASAPENPDGGLQEANARLIAAAPDLLSACEALLRFAENSESEFGIILGSANSARRAIAKAKGTTK